MSEARAEVVVTGTTWMGGGIGSIDTALRRLFTEAQDEVLLTAYNITGGADLLFDWMETALARGVQIWLIVNRLDEQSTAAVERLQRLNRSFPHLHLYNFTRGDAGADLHAKAIIADRSTALIGSSNLSRRGLLENHEMAVLLEGPVVTEVARAFDLVLNSENATQV